MLIAAFFIKTWKQPICPPTDKWVNKLECIATMGIFGYKKELSSDKCYNMDEP